LHGLADHARTPSNSRTNLKGRARGAFHASRGAVSFAGAHVLRLYHRHNLEHEDGGMMRNLLVFA
jgi:FtsP/CotA-like multicopper oxidase with cupredoxin domain